MMRSLLFLALTAPLALQTAVASAQSTTVLTDMTLLDGTGAAPRAHVTIFLRDDKITRICYPEDRCLHGLKPAISGKFIMPSLISAHSHLALLDRNGDFSSDEYTAANVTAQLQQYERYGITTVLSLGMNRDLVFDVRDQQRAGKLGGATLFTAGRGIGVPDGMPPFNAGPDQVDKPSTVEQARQAVDRTVAQHADIVKVWVDSNHGKAPEISDDLLKAIVAEAHSKHLRVAAHVYALEDARRIVGMGVDVLAHSIRDKDVDDNLIALLKQHGTWYIPTLTVDESFFVFADHPELLDDPFLQNAVPAETLARLKSAAYRDKVLADPGTAQHRSDLAIASRNLKRLYDAGIPIGFGTDSGAVLGRIPGYSEHRELALMVAAGLTPTQAIACATSHNANFLGIKTGVLQAGNQADLLILDADPTKDIHNTTKIEAVFHHGVRIDSK